MSSRLKKLWVNKKAMLLAFLMGGIFLTMPVWAQDHPPSAEDMIAKMQSKLNLTQDQVTAITPIMEKYASKREELHQSMEDGTADRNSIHIQMKQLRKDEKQELSLILSAEQLGQWEKMSKQGHKHNSGG